MSHTPAKATRKTLANPSGSSPRFLPKTPEGEKRSINVKNAEEIKELIDKVFLKTKEMRQEADLYPPGETLKRNLLEIEDNIYRILNFKGRYQQILQLTGKTSTALTPYENQVARSVISSGVLVMLAGMFDQPQKGLDAGNIKFDQARVYYNELVKRLKSVPPPSPSPSKSDVSEELNSSNEEPNEISDEVYHSPSNYLEESDLAFTEVNTDTAMSNNIQDFVPPDTVSGPESGSSSSSSSSVPSSPSPSPQGTPRTPASIKKEIEEIDRRLLELRKISRKRLTFEESSEEDQSEIEISNSSFGDDIPPGGDPPPVPATDAVNDPKDTDEVIVDDENIDAPPQDESLRSQLGIPEHSGAFPEPTISGNRKWGPDQAEWQKEGGRSRMQQSPHDRLRTAEALLMKGDINRSNFSTDERIGVSADQVSQFEDQVLDHTPQAMAQKRVGMAMQLADDIFAADFRAWLTNGRTIIHEKPEVRNVVAKRRGGGLFRFQRDRNPQTAISENKQYRLPATPLWSSLHKIRGAQEYIDTFVDQEAAFQRKLNAMLLRGPQTVDEAFWYYKFVIRGEVASAEDKELFNQL